MEFNFVEQTKTNTKEVFTPQFSRLDLKNRQPVWQAMSEVWLHEILTDFDLNYISIRLADSHFDEEALISIFDDEVRPAMSEISGFTAIEDKPVDHRLLENVILLQIEKKNNKTGWQQNWEAFQSKVGRFLRKGKKNDERIDLQDCAQALATWGKIMQMVNLQREEQAEPSFVLQPERMNVASIRHHAEDIE